MFVDVNLERYYRIAAFEKTKHVPRDNRKITLSCMIPSLC